MNTINASTCYTPFQLRFGKSPCILPPLIPTNNNMEDEPAACDLIESLTQIELTAQDNLLTAKIKTAIHTSLSRSVNK
jgi:hypothetical protein